MASEDPITHPAQQPPEQARRFIIEHARYGVFLGVGLGLAFWTDLDDLGSTAAPTFPSQEEAARFAEDFLSAHDSREMRYLEVIADLPQFQASVEACVRAGARGWGIWREPSPRGDRPGRPH